MPGITKVYEDGTFINGTANFAGTGSITVEAGAGIVGGFGMALVLSGGAWKVQVDGVVQDNVNQTIQIDSTGIAAPIKNSTLTVGSEGTIYNGSIGFAAVGTRQAMDVINSGHIVSASYGIIYDVNAPSSTNTISIINNANGLISGGAESIHQSDSTHALIIKNAGDIEGLVTWGGALTLTNTGVMAGGLVRSSPVTQFGTSITNSGDLLGLVALSDSNDTVKNTGFINDDIRLFSGKNSLTNSSLIQGNITAGAGDDTMTNTGTVDGTVGLGDGVNKLTNSGTIGSNITFGAQADTFTNTKMVGGSVSFGGGANKFTNGGTVGLFVLFGDADDTFTNTGTVDGSVGLGHGVNKFTNSHLIGADVTAGDQADTFTNTGTVDGSVALGGGADVLKNTGTIGALVDLGDGANKLTNGGTIYQLAAGDGNDTIVNTGTISFGTDLGKGDDLYTGSNGNDAVYDNAGDDTYKLGGGNDLLVTSGVGTDFCDGGAGLDTVNLSSAGAGIAINFDTKAATVLAVTIAGSTLQAIAGGTATTVKNFESVIGSSASDVIVGGAGKETLSGSGGDDSIVGGGGGDLLTGGSGVDTFFYFKTTDSGPARATQDQILDFEGAGISGGDVIDLSNIDAKPKTIGDDAFTFLGSNIAFNHIAGEVRVLIDGADAVLQGDINGDGKADFAITVIGGAALNAGDLTL